MQKEAEWVDNAESRYLHRAEMELSDFELAMESFEGLARFFSTLNAVAITKTAI